MTANRNDVVVVDGRGSAHGDVSGLALAGGAVLGLGVEAADGIGVIEGVRVDTEEADVAVLGPGRLPGVADEPIVHPSGIVGSVPDKGDGVVDVKRLGVEGALEDSGLVRLPGRSGDGNGNGSGLSDSIEEGEVIVGGELDVVLDVGDSAGDAVRIRSILEEARVRVRLR